MPVVIEGTVAPGFEGVKKLFTKHFEDGLEDKAQCCVYVGEEKVVDLWGSSTGDTTYNGDSLQTVFSNTKSLTAICTAMMVDRKFIKYSDKVTQYWPEFGQNGKDILQIQDILRHEGGVPYLDVSVNVSDIRRDNLKNNSLGKIIEGQVLNRPDQKKYPGAVRQYHSITRGWILNEIFRRVDPDSRTIGEFLHSEVAEPLGVDVHIGVGEKELERCHSLVPAEIGHTVWQSMWPKWLGRKIEPNLIEFVKTLRISKTLTNPDQSPAFDHIQKNESLPVLVKKLDLPEVKKGEVPSANGQCSARGLAKLAALMANKGVFKGVRIMSEETWDSMHKDPIRRVDYGNLFLQDEFTQGGINHYRIHDDDPPEERYTISRKWRNNFFGWQGFGGPVFQWHPGHKVGFGYTCTYIAWYDPFNTKAANLQREVVECLEKKNTEK